MKPAPVPAAPHLASLEVVQRRGPAMWTVRMDVTPAAWSRIDEPGHTVAGMRLTVPDAKRGWSEIYDNIEWQKHAGNVVGGKYSLANRQYGEWLKDASKLPVYTSRAGDRFAAAHDSVERRASKIAGGSFSAAVAAHAMYGKLDSFDEFVRVRYDDGTTATYAGGELSIPAPLRDLVDGAWLTSAGWDHVQFQSE